MEENNNYPLIVNLDGCLVKNNTRIESIIKSINANFLNIFVILFLLFSKKKLNRYLQNYIVKIDELKFNKKVIKLIDNFYNKKKIILIADTNNNQAKLIFNYVNKFDNFYSYDQDKNYIEKNKSNYLVNIYGKNKFDYVGNSIKDISIWKNSNSSYYAGDYSFILKIIKFFFKKKQISNLGENNSISSYCYNLIKLVRVQQWVKNLMIFSPIMLANQINYVNIKISLIGFFIFSLFSSFTYIINDILDLHSDRKKMILSERPLASYTLPLKDIFSILFFFFLLNCFLLFFFIDNLTSQFILISYFFVTLLYCLLFKKIFFLDILMLSLFLNYRVFFGSNLTNVDLSNNFILFLFFFFIFLGILKRIVEINNFYISGEYYNKNVFGRPYKKNDLQLLKSISLFSFLMSQIFCILFLTSKTTLSIYSNFYLPVFIIMILILWSIRIIYLTFNGKINLDPISFSTKDTFSIISGLLILFLFLINFQ